MQWLLFLFLGHTFIFTSPERQAEEGKLGPDFLPSSSHLKPVNYPVGKPLEVCIIICTLRNCFLFTLTAFGVNKTVNFTDIYKILRHSTNN